MRKAIFPGSFDPITQGHVDLVMRSLPIFEKIIVAVGQNAQKNYLFDLEQRKNWIRASFQGVNKIEVSHFDEFHNLNTLKNFLATDRHR